MIKPEKPVSPAPILSVIPKNLSPEFHRYLDVLAGNLIEQGGYGRLEIEFEAGKPKHTWYTVGHKAGHQF